MATFGPWTLTDEEAKRLARYRKSQDLMTRKASRYDKVYQRDKERNEDPWMPQLWVNIPGLVCRAAADLILSEPPKLTSADNAVQLRIDALLKVSKLATLAWRAVYWTCGLGDAFLVIADKQTKQGPVPMISLRRAVGSVARGLRPEDDVDQTQALFSAAYPGQPGTQLFTLYAAGSIQTSAYDKGGAQVGLPEGYEAEIDTGEDVPLFVHLAALRGDECDEGFGESDFSGTIDLCFEISHRLRQISKILDRHAEPILNTPAGVLDENAKFDVERKKVIEKGVGGESAEYLVWQSQLAEAYTEIDRLTNLILLLTETPPALWGLDKSGNIQSGRALMFQLLSGLGKARRTGGMLREALIEATRLTLRRQDILAGKAPGDYADIDCALSKTFIVDQLEIADWVSKLRSAGAMSMEAAVAIAQGLTGEAKDVEVQRIKDESKPAAPIGLTNPPPLT